VFADRPDRAVASVEADRRAEGLRRAAGMVQPQKLPGAQALDPNQQQGVGALRIGRTKDVDPLQTLQGVLAAVQLDDLVIGPGSQRPWRGQRPRREAAQFLQVLDQEAASFRRPGHVAARVGSRVKQRHETFGPIPAVLTARDHLHPDARRPAHQGRRVATAFRILEHGTEPGRDFLRPQPFSGTRQQRMAEEILHRGFAGQVKYRVEQPSCRGQSFLVLQWTAAEQAQQTHRRIGVLIQELPQRQQRFRRPMAAVVPG